MSDRIKRPHYSRGSILQWVNHLAKTIRQDGKIADVFLLDVAIRNELEQHPELVNLDQFARDCRKFWERSNNRVCNKSPSIFVPGAWVTVGKRARGLMRELVLPGDIMAWMDVEDEAQRNFERSMARKRSYKLQVIAEWGVNPDCPRLGDLESKLRGYTPSEKDDDPFSGIDDDGDEGEPA